MRPPIVHRATPQSMCFARELRISTPMIRAWIALRLQMDSPATRAHSRVSIVRTDPYAQMSGATTPPWPKAGSLYALQNLPAERRAPSQDAIDLVKALHEKVRREFRPTAPASSAEI